MAVIKVFDSEGVKTLQSMDVLSEIPYDVSEEEIVEVPEDQAPTD